MKDKIALTKAWIAKADSDLQTMRILFENEGPLDTACFHAQQAIEKLLKAFLAYHQRNIPKIHDLDELQRLCLSIDAIPQLEEVDLTEITDFAVEMRYDLEFWPDVAAAELAMQLAEHVRRIILNHLPRSCRP